MSETEKEFKTKIKVELTKFIPPIFLSLFNVDALIDQNVEVLIDWLRKNKSLMTRLLDSQ